MLWFSSQAEFGNDEYRMAFIALFTFAALASFEILMPLGSAFLHIGQVIASAERVTDIIEQQPLVTFNGKAEFDQNATTLIEAKALSFAYPERQNRALENLNLTIQKGQKVAILGKTGSGKSTLLQLLVRNYDANQGDLFLAGKPIADYAEDTLRSQFCF